jgi:hypothetical protein
MSKIKQHLIDAYEVATKSEAKRIETIFFERYNTNYYRVYSWANENGNPDIEYKGYDLQEARESFNSCRYVEGYEHQAVTWFLECGDDVIDSKDVPPINAATQRIMWDVQQHFGGKYSTFEMEDGEIIKLRISDHSGKHCNNGYGEKCISIVIANDNVTERFYTQGPEGISNEYYYDEETTAEQIIDDINTMLENEGVKPFKMKFMFYIKSYCNYRGVNDLIVVRVINQYATIKTYTGITALKRAKAFIRKNCKNYNYAH